MIKFILPLILILSCCHSFANLSSIELESKQKTLIGINTEIVVINTYINQLKSREDRIFEFKIKFSDLITSFTTNSMSKIAFKKNRKELEGLEVETNVWFEEAGIKYEKMKDLLSVLEQLTISYKEAAAKALTTQQDILNEMIAESEAYKARLLILLKKIEDHLAFLKKFRADTDQWKNFLITKISKGLDVNLIKWSLNPVFLQPIESSQGLIREIRGPIKEAQSFEFLPFIQQNKGVILYRFFLVAILVAITSYLSQFFKKWILSREAKLLDPSVSSILAICVKKRYFLVLFPFLILVPSEIPYGPYQGYPVVLGYCLAIFLFTFLWWGLAYPLINFFTKELNKTIKNKISFEPISMMIFIITKTGQNFFELDNGLIYFINSILLAIISYRFFKLCFHFKINEQKYLHKEFVISLRSGKWVMIFFAVAFFASSILEIIGFTYLGDTIQTVLVENISYFGLGWITYQILNYLVIRKENKISQQEKRKLEFISLARNALNMSFVLAIILIVVKSWHSTIYIFADFWEITLLSLGEYRLTIDKPLKLIISYYIIHFIYIFILFSLESALLRKYNISKKYAPNIAAILRYTLMIIYIGIGAAILGATYKNLIIFASALGVGIGFGLQNIVSNFISGVILLFERPIRVGDIIEVNGFFSKVKNIGIRSTIVESLENSSVVIPNSEILSNKVINWTLNGNIIAIKCRVGVAYGTDTNLVSKILEEVADQNIDVLDLPGYQVWFNEFGDSSLNFVLKVWINRPSDKFMIHSDLMHKVNEKLKEHNVTIPFPQRDVHLYKKEEE